MKIFLATSMVRYPEINESIYSKLSDFSTVFLSNKFDFADMDAKEIADFCYDNVNDSDLIIAIAPFGLSVACELGYCIGLNKKLNAKKKIILFNVEYDEKLNAEDMYMPFFDYVTSDIIELVSYVKALYESEGKLSLESDI